jgi:glycosidase
MKKQLCFILGILALSTFVFGQDTIQYGTPFSGVPDNRDAVIYQVNTRCFSSTHNFQGVIDRLDNIKALGVNVVYLMPIYPVGILKAINSPYCIKDYKAVGTEFGTLTDLRNLIDSAHSKGMAVILDFVANHTSWDNSWISNKAWYKQDANGNIVSPNGWNDVAQLNFANTGMRTALISAMRYWVFSANCDGFRCDYTDGPPVDFWKQAIDSLRNITSHKLILFAEGTRSANYVAGFDLNFGMAFYNQLETIFSSNQSVKLIDGLNTSEYAGASGGQQIVRYITNHDVNSSDGTPLDLFGNNNGSLAAFVIVSYMKGVPFIYNGQEVATSFRLTFPFTSTTIDWNVNPGVTDEYAKIISFRNRSIAVRRGTLKSFSSADVCAFTKTSGTENVLVISNLRNKTISYTLPAALANTVWTDAFADSSVSLGTKLLLPPYTYIILKGGTLVSVKKLTENQIADIKFYPNPSNNKTTTVQLINMNENEDVSMTIYNISGKEVFSKQYLKSGQIGLNFPSGIYIVNIRSKQIFLNKKIVIE